MTGVQTCALPISPYKQDLIVVNDCILEFIVFKCKNISALLRQPDALLRQLYPLFEHQWSSKKILVLY